MEPLDGTSWTWPLTNPVTGDGQDHRLRGSGKQAAGVRPFSLLDCRGSRSEQSLVLASPSFLPSLLCFCTGRKGEPCVVETNSVVSWR